MIQAVNDCFFLHTDHTSYLFGKLPTGQLEHFYYGRKIRIKDVGSLWEKNLFSPGNTIVYDKEHPTFTPEDLCLEMSAEGKGDIREPFLEVIHQDGSRTGDFVFDHFQILEEKAPFETLPGSYSENGKTEHLVITMKDRQYGLGLELHYFVYPECDVITRSAKLINESKETVRVQRLMSLQLDLADSGYVCTSFHGAWAREMMRTDTRVKNGKFVIDSFTGTSSNRSNPFFMLSEAGTGEHTGACFGFNLIYSGNHAEMIEVNSFGKTRILTGINPRGFCFRLEPGASLEAPEAVCTYSDQGFNGLSVQMHTFVREHIVRGLWKKKARPVLLNSWEATYFDLSERKLFSLAKRAKEVGIELFVVDDGWFGDRTDDTKSLGDWTVNEKIFPGGLKGFCDKIRGLGMDFGIWVEPEMVNVNSNLYEMHPDWVIQIPERPHSEGRNQRILDLTNPRVQDYIIEEMSKVFSGADIAYVKWDMNRIFSDVFASSLPADRQGEVFHRYVCGLYRCMRELTKRFPEILFEGCSSGGNRFDLGILSYFPQIWASDNTDALCRAEIQNGYSYGYPQSTYTAHISGCPNHQTLRNSPLETRFQVASFGVLGYECNLCDLKKEELAAIQAQISLYKQWREVLQFGQFYRGRTFSDREAERHSVSIDPSGHNEMEWTIAAKDRKSAVGLLLQSLVVPNRPHTIFHVYGLQEDRCYHFCNRPLQVNVKEFGDLVNTIAPVHIRQDSIAHNLVAKFVKMKGETQDFIAYGDELMYAGVRLQPTFAATGYSEEVRFYPDFGSRMYFLEEVKS